MKKKKNHEAKSLKGIFVGYALNQPLCYNVLLSGPPIHIEVSTHVTFITDLNKQQCMEVGNNICDLPTNIPLVHSSGSNNESDDTLVLQTKDTSRLNDNKSENIICTFLSDHQLSSCDIITLKNIFMGKYFCDDEDFLIYKVLDIYKYKGFYAIKRGLVLSNDHIQLVDDPIWPGDAVKLIELYE